MGTTLPNLILPLTQVSASPSHHNLNLRDNQAGSNLSSLFPDSQPGPLLQTYPQTLPETSLKIPSAPLPETLLETSHRLLLEQRARQTAERTLKAVQEQRLCLLCISRAKCVVFLPCAHMLACHFCGPAYVRVLSEYRCPAPGCNQPIRHVVVAQDVGMVADEQVARAGFG